MTEQEIKENLCYYDPRNPDGLNAYGNYKKEDCSCDNCFYGRAKMAEELLKYIPKIKER